MKFIKDLICRIKNEKYKKYNNLYPEVKLIYEEFKKINEDFQKKHKFRSGLYYLRLVKSAKCGQDLAKVKTPRNCIMHFENVLKGPSLQGRGIVIPDDMLSQRPSEEELFNYLEQFDVVSFDIFDTLILRPFEKPTDLFYLLEAQNGILNFCELRRQAETSARRKTEKPNYEVDIYDIYKELSKYCKIDSQKGAEKEIELELNVCYANEYMKKVFTMLRRANKKIILISDMYLPSEILSEILKKNGLDGYEKIYVSCENGFNKASGKLFKIAEKDYSESKKFIHIGDNKISDVKGAKLQGWEVYYYQQNNEFGHNFRPETLVSPVSSVYKGIVNNYMYSGAYHHSAQFDFGFIYAGFVVSGFCEWLNKFAVEADSEKLLFLARDMDIFYKVYNKHYKKFDSSYAATSRFALQELIVQDFPEEFFHHTIKARCDRGYTVEQAFKEINLEFLLRYCKDYKLNAKDFIVADKIERLNRLFDEHNAEIAEHFSDNEEAAKQYFLEKIKGAKRICVIDLGWRGSVLAYLKFLLEKKWKICDKVEGVLFGSTINETSINLISRGIVHSYAYNHLQNRDFLRNFDWEVEYINLLLIESIFSAEEPSLIEYNLDKQTSQTKLLTYHDNPNKDTVREIQNGIIAFVDEFEGFRKQYREYYPISAVDAYESLFKILVNYDYMSRVIGHVVDTPYAIAGLNISERKYVPIGKLMYDRKMIPHWPIQ